jgi:hypothetical protein
MAKSVTLVFCFLCIDFYLLYIKEDFFMMKLIRGSKFWYTSTSIARAQSLKDALTVVGFEMDQIGLTSEGTNVPILFSMRLNPGMVARDSVEWVTNSFEYDKERDRVVYKKQPPLPAWAIVDTRPYLLDTEYKNILYTQHGVMNDRRGSLREKYRFILQYDAPSDMTPLVRSLILETL